MITKLLLMLIFFLAIVNESKPHEPVFKHEIGLVPGVVYMADNNKMAIGLQLEYQYILGTNSPDLHIYGSVENVFTNEKHYGVSIGMGITLLNHLEVSVGPGLVMHGKDLLFSAHVEAGYGFDINRFVIGPVFEFAYIGHHSHAMAGIAIGLAF